MNYLLESLFVGIYCCLIYLALFYTGLTANVYLMLFIVGFLKHFFGYFFKIHDSYCQYGCRKYDCSDNNKNARAKRNDFILTGESILEGIVFIILGSFLSFFFKSKLLLYFILGVCLHIITEKIGLHAYFCKERCISS